MESRSQACLNDYRCNFVAKGAECKPCFKLGLHWAPFARVSIGQGRFFEKNKWHLEQIQQKKCSHRSGQVSGESLAFLTALSLEKMPKFYLYKK